MTRAREEFVTACDEYIKRKVLLELALAERNGESRHRHVERMLEKEARYWSLDLVAHFAATMMSSATGVYFAPSSHSIPKLDLLRSNLVARMG